MDVRSTRRGTWTAATLLLFAASAFAAGHKTEFRYNVGPAATVSINNRFGAVTVRPASGNQVIVVATTTSDKVEPQSSQNGNRVEVRTRFHGAASDSDARVDYLAQVPPGASLSVRAATGPVEIQGIRGDLSIQSESGPITVSDANDAHLQVYTVDAPVTLNNFSGTYVYVTSVGGAVSLNRVSGPRVTISTSNGAIRYAGDFGGNGSYSLGSHSGNLDVLVPASASVDLDARSLSGRVDCDLPLQSSSNSPAPTAGHALKGQAGGGASAVHLSSFTGNISIKKQ